ncbi:hypothetical protein [Bordetella muralis]|uniref:hypothetical protein n=1 Tax=Bordetella muralis TaxID=1649130 RepID=UPI0039EE78DD
MNILVLDSITQVPPRTHDTVAYCASHGGSYCGSLALSTGLRGVILCDAGVGLEQAGIAALPILEAAGIPAATIGHLSARIGNGQDGHQRGRISHANAIAARLGVAIGDTCHHALETLACRASPGPLETNIAHADAEHRSVVRLSNGGEVTLVDSNSLITATDTGKIVICGSHGGLLGDDPGSAVRVDVRGIVFNDAAVGIDQAGTSRLPALDERGIAAACVSAWTARIGDAQSSYRTGVISALNRTAIEAGASLGMTAQAFALQLAHH